MAINIKVGAKLDTKGLESQLNSELKKLSDSAKIDLKFNSKNIDLGVNIKQIDKIKEQIKDAFNFGDIGTKSFSSIKLINEELGSLGSSVKNLGSIRLNENFKDISVQAKEAYNEFKETKKLAEEIGRLHEKSDLKINTSNGLQEAKEVNRALEEQYALQEKINTSKANMQSKLNTLSSNKFIDSSVITEVQNKLNAINTNTPEKEIKELETSIKNLGSSEPQIVRIQNALEKATTNLNSAKEKLNSGNFTNIGEISANINKYESEVNKLKETQNKLSNGESFNGAKISSEINSVTNASRNLSNSLSEGSTHVETFGSRLKNAFSDMGFYFSAYQGIQMVTNTLKDGIQTITDIDTKMRDLNRVADDVPQSILKNFPEQANATAISLGQTTENAIEATTVWKQLGYSFDDASNELSKWSMILSNVGDISASESTNDLVSVLKAFKLEASDTQAVVDSLNEVTNIYIDSLPYS